MPLPTDAATPWPPPQQDAAGKTYREWAAWWGGDVSALAKVYASAVGFTDPVIAGNDNRRGLVALQPRLFHGAPAARGTLQSAKLHIPLASDIAMTSADLLFGEPPALVAPKDDAAARNRRPAGTGDGESGTTSSGTGGSDVASRPVIKQSPTQDRLDQYMADGLQAVLLEGAEIAAAFGGVYLRVGWDTEISDGPLFDAIPPDAAAPEFRSGRLTAVVFHRVLPSQGDGNTWRHLERHEKGRILHGLYCSGDDKTLGRKMPLADHPDTAMFASLVAAGDAVETGADGLTAEYVPNMRPNRTLRGSQLGRSDYAGIVGVMDCLDEAWTSWIRDLRLGKGRILVPDCYLQDQGRGQGTLFDAEQEVFQLVNELPGNPIAMSNVQFDIRVAEHQQTCAALTEQAVRGAGYSAQSFGIQDDGGMATATEVNARVSRSTMTRGKKINYWRPALARLIRTALQIDVAKFKPAGVNALLPQIEWPDGIATDPQTLAQTLQLLKSAEAASTRTRVELLHPDWPDERVAQEVKDIEAEGAPPAMPQIGPPGTGLSPAGTAKPAVPAAAAAGTAPPKASSTGQTPTGQTPTTRQSGATPTGAAATAARSTGARPATPRTPHPVVRTR